MTPIEKLMDQNRDLKFKLQAMPKGLSGLTIGREIYIDKEKSETTQYEVMLEELAHVAKTVGDITKQDTTEKVKQERLARSIAYQEAVPLDRLIECFNEQPWSVDEMAEYFGVSQKFLLEALENYRDKRGLFFEYHGYYFDLRQGLNITKI